MSDQIFQQAYDRVRHRHSEDAWLALSPRQITEAIYQEMRQIDAEIIRQRQAEPTPDEGFQGAGPA